VIGPHRERGKHRRGTVFPPPSSTPPTLSIRDPQESFTFTSSYRWFLALEFSSFPISLSISPLHTQPTMSSALNAVCSPFISSRMLAPYFNHEKMFDKLTDVPIVGR
jgi:hypothetical protein